jgi:hypothetical protein
MLLLHRETDRSVIIVLRRLLAASVKGIIVMVCLFVMDGP